VSEAPIYLVQGRPAALRVQPTQPAILAAPGDPPLTLHLTVSNVSQGPISWSATAEAAWARVETPSGSGQNSLVRLTLTPTGLTAGDYTTVVRVRSPAGDQDVPVTLRVSATLQRTYLPFIR
jgi:hypothetical protein